VSLINAFSESVIMRLVSLIMRGEFNHAFSECVTAVSLIASCEFSINVFSECYHVSGELNSRKVGLSRV
jgi:hypothetical protein